MIAITCTSQHLLLQETITLHETDILTANISWTPPPEITGGDPDPETTNLFDAYEIYVTEDLANDEDEVTEYVATVAKDDLTYIVTGLKPTTNYTFEVGTVLYAADQFPTQRSDLNPIAMGETGMFNLNVDKSNSTPRPVPPSPPPPPPLPKRR